MSELKAVHAFDVYEAYTKTGNDDAAQVYLKSEADKMIAELTKKLDLYKRGFKEDDKTNAYLYVELRHQKYKRCLAMRNMCRYAQYSYSYLMENESCKILPNNIDFRRYNKKYHFYIRWRKRWMELAEKFKEAK